VSPYRGLWAVGIKTYLHHRTLENYLDAFLAAGLQLTKLADVPALADSHGPQTCLPDGARFPASCSWGSPSCGRGITWPNALAERYNCLMETCPRCGASVGAGYRFAVSAAPG
jgi:hypothetical protein